MLYLADTPDEFDLIVNAVKKYETQTSDDEFNFGTLLMHLAYTTNQTDKMLELFLSENPSRAFTERNLGRLLMNKLFGEKRYDDCIKVYNRIVENGSKIQIKNKINKDGSTRHAIIDIVATQIVAEALLKKVEK